MAPKIHVDDIGTAIDICVTDENDNPVDLGAATALEMRFRGPGTAFARVPALFTDGSDGVMRYVLTQGDIEAAGNWTVQAYVETADGAWHSSFANFQVAPNIVIPAGE